ncbi:MAG: hypothetical protein ACUVWN_04625 [bacterium]
MERKGQAFGWDGKKLAGYCKQCGAFTLDTVEVLCSSCSLKKFIKQLFGGKEECENEECVNKR